MTNYAVNTIIFCNCLSDSGNQVLVVSLLNIVREVVTQNDSLVDFSITSYINRV